MLDARNTSKEIQEAAPEVAVWGIGAIEQYSMAEPKQCLSSGGRKVDRRRSSYDRHLRGRHPQRATER